MSLSPKTVQRLLEVKQHILAEPNRLLMSAWFKKGNKILDTLNGHCLGNRELELNPPCGTAACIAGWICLLDPAFNPRDEDPNGQLACELLGEDLAVFDQLFLVSNWPRLLQREFHTTDLRKRASVAGKAIDRFIAGNGNWYAS